MRGPVAVGVILIVHIAEVPVPARAQDPPLTVNVPVGVLLVPVSVSATVTVHVKAVPTVPDVGQETVVFVVRRLTVTLVLPVLVA